MKKEIVGSIYVISSGILWGMMTIFVRILKNDYGLSTPQIIAIRFTVGAIFLVLFMFFYDKKQFLIKIKDIPAFIVMGIATFFCTGYFYFAAVMLIPVSIASIIMYTAPFWVLIISTFLFKEKLTMRKIIALIIAFAGCVCVSGFGFKNIKTIGIIYSLLSSFAYAGYSIFGKALTKKYQPLTVMLYAYIFAFIGAIIICDPGKTIPTIIGCFDIRLMLLMIGLGVITNSIPFSMYTIALSKIEAGKASILSLTEPMMTTIVGTIVFKEFLGPLGYVGILEIVFAIVLINLNNNNIRNNDGKFKKDFLM